LLLIQSGIGKPSKVTEAYGDRIAVSSGHRLASEIVVQTYLDGGNIIDAVVAGAAVLGVVLPYACGIGGDAYLLYHEADTGITHALNGTGAAPSGAVLERFAGGIPSTGIHAPTVPGALALWEDALALYGTRSLGETLRPAIALARDGFPVHLGLIENIEEKHALIRRDKECARLFLGEHVKLGLPFVQEDLARVLQTIAAEGAQAFYAGGLGDEFVTKSAAAGGLFSRDDLIRHKTLRQNPLRYRFYGHDVVTMPPNSVGLHLLLQLAALQRAAVHDLDPDTVAFWRLTIACWRWSLRVSENAVGDPEDTEVIAERLLRSVQSGANPVETTDVPAPSSGDTSNLVAMDEKGNCVSLIQSVSAPFASGIVLPGTGILLNNRMRGFDIRRGNPNCVGPGRRPKHTLVPVMIEYDGEAVMAIGTPGAAGQPLTLAQILARSYACGEDLATAVQAPRWSVGLSNQLMVEPATAPEIIESLHTDDDALEICSERHVRFGSVKAAFRHNGRLRAVADYRRVAGPAAV
jgi:gamma-glutamyltranspeptidase/glutathione hydrolase